MALTRSIDSFIVGPDGNVSRTFLAQSALDWATEHMQLRYAQAAPQAAEPRSSYVSRCFSALQTEHATLRGWVLPDGSVSPMLRAKHAATRQSKSIGEGIGWDFKPSGDPEPRMLHFKASLMAAERLVWTLAPEDRHAGNPTVAGLTRLVHSAYRNRAEIYNWRDGELKGQTFDGSVLAARWAAFQTFTFFIELDAIKLNYEWLWGASQCQALLGPVNEVNPVGASLPGQRG